MWCYIHASKNQKIKVDIMICCGVRLFDLFCHLIVCLHKLIADLNHLFLGRHLLDMFIFTYTKHCSLFILSGFLFYPFDKL
jgi:hypothetical protein